MLLLDVLTLQFVRNYLSPARQKNAKDNNLNLFNDNVSEKNKIINPTNTRFAIFSPYKTSLIQCTVKKLEEWVKKCNGILIYFFFKSSCYNAQKMKFSFKDFFSKCDQIRRKLRTWSRLLKKSLMEKFIFWTVLCTS